jgi:hypothetical protein
MFVNLFKMGEFSVKIVAGDENGLFRCVIFLEHVSYYFVLRNIIADAETLSCCNEHNH